MIAEGIETLEDFEIRQLVSKKKEQHRVEIRKKKTNDIFRKNRLLISERNNRQTIQDQQNNSVVNDQFDSNPIELQASISDFLNAYSSNNILSIRTSVSRIQNCVTPSDKLDDLDESNEIIYQSNIIRLLISYLSIEYDTNEDSELQSDVIWIIAHFVSQQNEKHINFIVENIPISVFYRLIEHQQKRIKQNAVLSIYNILSTQNGVEYLIKGGIINFIAERMINIVQYHPFLLSHVVLIVKDIFQLSTTIQFNMTMEQIHPLLEILLPLFNLANESGNKVTVILDDLFETIIFITQREDDDIDQFYSNYNGLILKTLTYISKMNKKDSAYLISPLRIIQNLSNSYDQIIESMVQIGLLDVLSSLSNHGSLTIKRMIAQILANVTACGVMVIHYLMEHKQIILDLIKLINSHDFILKKEATIALCNLMIVIGKKQIEEFQTEYDPIKILLDETQSPDVDLNVKILTAFLHIIKLGELIKNKRNYKNNQFSLKFNQLGGREKIMHFAESNNHRLNIPAEKLLARTYIVEDNENDVQIVPNNEVGVSFGSDDEDEAASIYDQDDQDDPFTDF